MARTKQTARMPPRFVDLRNLTSKEMVIRELRVTRHELQFQTRRFEDTHSPLARGQMNLLRSRVKTLEDMLGL